MAQRTRARAGVASSWPRQPLSTSHRFFPSSGQVSAVAPSLHNVSHCCLLLPSVRNSGHVLTCFPPCSGLWVSSGTYWYSFSARELAQHRAAVEAHKGDVAGQGFPRLPHLAFDRGGRLGRDVCREYMQGFALPAVGSNDVFAMRASLSRFVQESQACVCECCPFSACVSPSRSAEVLSKVVWNTRISI